MSLNSLYFSSYCDSLSCNLDFKKFVFCALKVLHNLGASIAFKVCHTLDFRMNYNQLKVLKKTQKNNVLIIAKFEIKKEDKHCFKLFI